MKVGQSSSIETAHYSLRRHLIDESDAEREWTKKLHGTLELNRLTFWPSGPVNTDWILVVARIRPAIDARQRLI